MEPCLICMQVRYRCPVQICENGHCLDVGCLRRLLKETPVGSSLTCPHDNCVIDITQLVYREDLVKAQGPWVELTRYGRFDYLRIVVALGTKVSEVGFLFSQLTSGLQTATSVLYVDAVAHRGKLYFHVPQIVRVGRDEMPPCGDEVIARDEDVGTSIEIRGLSDDRGILFSQSAYCSGCALAIRAVEMINDRNALIQACVSAGHLEFVP